MMVYLVPMVDHLIVSMILILIMLMVGPCILRYMNNYIKQRINSIQLLALWTKYSLPIRIGWVNNDSFL